MRTVLLARFVQKMNKHKPAAHATLKGLHMSKLINGLDADELKQKMSGLRDNPEMAKFQFRAHNSWLNGIRCHMRIQNFRGAGKENRSHRQAFELEADEPEVLMGTDQAPNATEALLYALTSCLNTTFITHATNRGIEVEELEIEARGDLDLRGFLGLAEGVRNGYNNIEITFRVKAKASEQEIRELCELAKARSPVFDIVSNRVAVETDVEVLEAAST
jgi:uncharacterized OsmC-like protein